MKHKVIIWGNGMNMDGKKGIVIIGKYYGKSGSHPFCPVCKTDKYLVIEIDGKYFCTNHKLKEVRK